MGRHFLFFCHGIGLQARINDIVLLQVAKVRLVAVINWQKNDPGWDQMEATGGRSENGHILRFVTRYFDFIYLFLLSTKGFSSPMKETLSTEGILFLVMLTSSSYFIYFSYIGFRQAVQNPLYAGWISVLLHSTYKGHEAFSM